MGEREVNMPMYIGTVYCHECGRAMYGSSSAEPVQTVHCVARDCAEYGVKFQVTAPILSLKEIGRV